MRFHILSVPYTQATKEFSACPFTQKARLFAIMMQRAGHEVTLYAGTETDVPGVELVTCMFEEERSQFLEGAHYTAAPWNPDLPIWKLFNMRAAIDLQKRVTKRDVLAIVAGNANRDVVNIIGGACTPVEIGIGHEGSFVDRRIWESYAWMHYCHGSARMLMNPTGAVIPGFFDATQFPAGDGGGDYLLFIGRLGAGKGEEIAADAAKHTKMRLIVAGHGTPPPGVDYVGVLGPDARARLIGSARAVLAPSQYIEPFGNTAVEAQLCGTPAITTDFGGFVETVDHGVGGFRCRSVRDFCRAIEQSGELDRGKIRDRAIGRYSLDPARAQYQRYFAKLT